MEGSLAVCRFVQQNRICKLPSMSHLPMLKTLNISNNEIKIIEGLQHCPLESLICAHNMLSSYESIKSLTDIQSLHTLDLQNNKLDDPRILDIFAKMPGLRCLYLKGNPGVSKIKNYR
jgi:dynein assembly factor 1, axonemal